MKTIRVRLLHLAGSIMVGLLLMLDARPAAAEVVAVVSARSPLGALSKGQVIDIFLGKMTRFPDGTPAIPINQIEGSPARDEFYLKFSGKSPAQIKAYWSKLIFTGRGQPPVEAANDTEIKKYLAENPNAIGYIERLMVDGNLKILAAP